MHAACEPDGPLVLPLTGVLPSPVCIPEPPCPNPPIAGSEPVEIVTLCKIDGNPVGLVYAPGSADNTVCPPVPGTPSPGYLGWIDFVVDPSILVAGLPPAGLSVCSSGGFGGPQLLCDFGALVAGRPTQFEYRYINKDSDTDAESIGAYVPGTNTVYVPVGPVRSCENDDVEHACAFNALGVKVADVDVNYSVTPPAVYNFGTLTPYSGPAYARLGLCDATAFVAVPMHECVGGVCVEFVRWFDAVTRVNVGDTLLSGASYTVVGVASHGPCVEDRHVEQACLATVVDQTIPNTFDVKRLDFSVVGGQANAFLHWVFDSNTGNGFPGATPIGGPNPSPIPMSNVGAVQAQLDAAFGAGHVGYAINPANPDDAYIYGLTATCVTDHTDLLWWGDVNSYNAKDGLVDGINPVPGNPTRSLRSVQVIKTIACDGTATTVLLEKDGTLIVPQPADTDWALGSCAYDLTVHEVCTVANGEVWLVIGRDPITGDVAWRRLEDVQGNIVPDSPIIPCVCE